MFSTTATWIDLPDREFFQQALDVARQRFESGHTDEEHVSVTTVKQKTPVVYMSSVSKPTDDDRASMDRKELNERGRRKFLMIDADFDPGQEEDSTSLREKIIQVAHDNNTHVLIYPTASYPDKPRFRAVMFTTRVMIREQYFKAMSWWFDQLGTTALDEADMRITANRNLPVFTNNEQLESVYSTLDDESLNALESTLWKEYKAPPKKKKLDYSADMASATRVNFEGIHWNNVDSIRAVRAMGQTRLGATRHSVWKFIQSVACGLLEGVVTKDTAHKMMRALAERQDNEHKAEQWYNGNVDMLEECMSDISNGDTRLDEIRPLSSYTELMTTMSVDTTA